MINNRGLCTIVFVTMLMLLVNDSFAQTSTEQSKVKADSSFRLSMLGNPTRLVLSCKDVIQSMAWWAKLGFTPTPGNTGRPDSAISLADGQVVITLVKDPLPTPILMFATPNIRMLKDSLDSLGIGVTYDVQGPTLGELRLLSPSGVHLAVRPSATERRTPTTGDSNIVCGKLTEISVSVTDFPLKKEVQYWTLLDFSERKVGTQPYPFSVITDGYINIGLHELRDIPSIGMTYFAPDMKDRIARLQKNGMTFIDEYKDSEGVLEHVYLASPDGQLVMLFNGTP